LFRDGAAGERRERGCPTAQRAGVSTLAFLLARVAVIAGRGVPAPAARAGPLRTVGSDAAQTGPSTGSAALQGHRQIRRVIGRTFVTFTMVTLLVGVSATFVVDSAIAATAGGEAPTLRAQVDSIGTRYLAAQEQSR